MAGCFAVWLQTQLLWPSAERQHGASPVGDLGGGWSERWRGLDGHSQEPAWPLTSQCDMNLSQSRGTEVLSVTPPSSRLPKPSALL